MLSHTYKPFPESTGGQYPEYLCSDIVGCIKYKGHIHSSVNSILLQGPNLLNACKVW